MKKKIKRKLLRKSTTKSGSKYYYELSETEYVIYAKAAPKKANSKKKGKGNFGLDLKRYYFL